MDTIVVTSFILPRDREASTMPAAMPLTPPQRLTLSREVLEGLATGDALGEACSYSYETVRPKLSGKLPPLGSLRYTDDTEMASAVLEVLVRLGGIDEDVLAWQFRRRYHRDSERGYGKMTRRWLEQTLAGEDWRAVTARAFGGGSYGNGSAMRVAPVGAWFHDDMAKVVKFATASAVVTHAHPEGIAGAVAVAVATAAAVAGCGRPVEEVAGAIFKATRTYTPEGKTADGIARAQRLGPGAPLREAVAALGNGSDISCMDTVPFCLWNACRCLADYREAIISTIEAGGDCDTNAAIVGAIVAGFTGQNGIPPDWLEAREALFIEGGAL
jgi:ADP-ribosylglycohydrolase